MFNCRVAGLHSCWKNCYERRKRDLKWCRDIVRMLPRLLPSCLSKTIDHQVSSLWVRAQWIDKHNTPKNWCVLRIHEIVFLLLKRTSFSVQIKEGLIWLNSTGSSVRSCSCLKCFYSGVKMFLSDEISVSDTLALSCPLKFLGSQVCSRIVLRYYSIELFWRPETDKFTFYFLGDYLWFEHQTQTL